MTPVALIAIHSKPRQNPLLNPYLYVAPNCCSICHSLIEGVCKYKHKTTSHTQQLLTFEAAAFDDVATIFDCLILN